MATIAYKWTHPDDGVQQGALVIANAGPGQVKGLWIDTWHQKEAQSLDAVEPNESEVLFEFTYGGDWGWQIAVLMTEALTITMRNIIPASVAHGGEAIAYEVMETQLLA